MLPPPRWVAFSAVLLLAATAPQPRAGRGAAAPPSLASVVGTLERYEAERRTVTVRTADGARVVFELARGVVITQGARRLAPQDLSRCTGRPVKVRYVEEKARKIARAITVASEAAPPSRPS
jgi:urease accessory protein UreE